MLRGATRARDDVWRRLGKRDVGREGEGGGMKKRLRSQREKERWGKKERGREGHKKTGKEMNAKGTAPRKSNGGEANVQMSLLPSPSSSPPFSFLPD